MINPTNKEIRYISYKFFLENGYEATNIRDICTAVKIKPSSLYFYYKSKKDLFLSIYDEIWEEKIKCMQSIEKLNKNLTSDMKFKELFVTTVEYHINNIINEKFLLRYHLFPSEEISTLIINRFRYWTQEENKIIEDLIILCIDAGILSNKKIIAECLQDYKKLIMNQIINMLIYNVKIGKNDINMAWDNFWNSHITSCHKSLYI